MAKSGRKPGGGTMKRPAAPVSADRLRAGWPQPGGGRVRLIRDGEQHAADALLALAGVGLEEHLAAAVADGSIAAVQLAACDGGQAAMFDTAFTVSAGPTLTRGMAATSMVLVAEDGHGTLVGTLSSMPPPALLWQAHTEGHRTEELVTCALLVAKLRGLAVAEHARGRGWGTALIKRSWQVYQQLGFQLVYGQFEIATSLERFYAANRFTVHAPGENLGLGRILPYTVMPEDGERLFSRWNPHGLKPAPVGLRFKSCGHAA